MYKKRLFFFLLYSSFTLIPNHFDIKNLTLDQKIGQLFMVSAITDENIAQNCIAKKPYRMDKEYIEELIRNYYIGGIIYLGKSDIEKQIERTHYFQSISTIPLLIGQDLEPGRIGAARFDDFADFHNNKTLGEINDISITKNVALAIGKKCKQRAVHINFAPVADINNNPHNPVINDRSFSSNKKTVANHAIAFAQGLAEVGIIACAKHFPGHGDTTTDSHYDLPVIAHNKERLNDLELYPFKELISHNIPAIMIGHLAIPAFEERENLPATFSKAIVTDLLQNTLGFSGLIITDALDMQAITKTYSAGQTALMALLAGNDILLCPTDVPAAVRAIKQALEHGIITHKEIDMHVEKILRIKQIIFNN